MNSPSGRSPLQVIPAIDLRDNRCVRLRQGRADDQVVYSDDPLAVAARWAAEGAEYLHVVDLDGAFAGRPVHAELIGRMAAALSIPIETGGGIRTDADIERLLGLGVDRVILGTRAVEHAEALGRLAERFGPHLAVGIDARAGKVQTRGWVETTDVSAEDLARRVAALGVQTVIYTDTATDGMLEGTNAGAVDAVCAAASCNVIASGGISSVADIRALHELERKNLTGAIVGKALYEGRIGMAELIAAAGGGTDGYVHGKS